MKLNFDFEMPAKSLLALEANTSVSLPISSTAAKRSLKSKIFQTPKIFIQELNRLRKGISSLSQFTSDPVGTLSNSINARCVNLTMTFGDINCIFA